MNFIALQQPVFNRGCPPTKFLDDLVAWGRKADPAIFAPNDVNDIYTQVRSRLGPWESPLHRRAVMLEVMRVLAGFESTWRYDAGVDTTRVAEDTPSNAEAGAWQVSYDSRYFGEDLRDLLRAAKVVSGVEFQHAMKTQPELAMEYVARLMRHTTKHNGPLYKNRSIFPKALQGEEQSIYPWLRRVAVAEFCKDLSQ